MPFRFLKYWYPSASVTFWYPAFAYASMSFCVCGVPSCIATVVYSSSLSCIMIACR